MRNRNDFGRAMDGRGRKTAVVRNGVVASRVSGTRYTVTLSDTGETVTATKEVSVDEFVVGQPVRVVGVSAAKTSTGTGWSIMGSGTEIASGGAVGSWTPYSGGHTHIIADVTGLQAALDLKADKSIQIIAGTGLSGGGTLAANRTLNLANTTVTPGTYTNSTFTVDAQGRITAASSGTGGVGSGRLITTTYPLLIDGGASADLSADRTLSIDGGWTPGDTLPIVDTTAVVKGSADATKLLRFEVDGFTTGTTRVLTPQNADGIIAALDTDNQVFTAPNITFEGTVAYSQTYLSDTSAPNLLSYDLRAVAAGVGGGIGFGGKVNGAATDVLAMVRGYKENATPADVLGGLRLFTKSAPATLTIRTDIAYDGYFDVLSDGRAVSGDFTELGRIRPAANSARGVRFGTNTTTNTGIIAPTGNNASLEFWTYQSAAWARTAELSSGLFVGEGLAAGFKHRPQTGGTNGVYTQIQDQRDYIYIDASSNAARSGAPGFLFRESHNDAATFANLVLIGVNGDVVLHASGSLDATNATTGNTFIGCVAGTPTGVPARSVTGAVALRYDTAASKLWAYNGGWAEIGGGGSYQPLDAALTALAGGSDFVQFTGPLTATKVFTLPNSNATLLYSGGALGTPASGTLTNCDGTAASLTAGSASKWASARNLAGNSVDGSANVAFANKFIVQGTTDTGLSGAQFLGALATGILKVTTTTGVLSVAAAGDFPTLNQSTTGSAATLTTPRAIYGNNFDGSAALTQIIASTYGGTGNGFTKFAGPATTEKTITLPNANATMARTDAGQAFTGEQSTTLSWSVYGGIAALPAADANKVWLYRTDGGGGAFPFNMGGHLVLQSRQNDTLGICLMTGATPTVKVHVTGLGRVGIGVDAPTGVLHLKAGTATASTAPLKFTSGTLLGTAEAGAVEFLTDAFYGTITTGAARKTFAFLESPSFTTPTLGVASATSINKVTITAPATSATLTIADGQTLSVGRSYYVAYVKYNFAVDGGAIGTLTPAVTSAIPDNAIIMESMFNSTTAVTFSGSGSIKFSCGGVDIGGPYVAGNLTLDQIIIGKYAAAPIKTTSATSVTATIATAAVTAGVIECWIKYYVAAA